MTSARLLRYTSYLAGFDYTVKFKRGIENQNTDCLSKVYINQNYVSADIFIDDEVHKVGASAVFEESNKTLTADNSETLEDKELSQIK